MTAGTTVLLESRLPDYRASSVTEQLSAEQLGRLAARVLDIESRAVQSLADRLDDSFARACTLCLQTTGRVIVTGMGKSGHIGGKIAATLASTASEPGRDGAAPRPPSCRTA